MFQPKGKGNQMITNFSIKKGKNIMTNTFKNNTLENKIEVLKEINAETAGWGINELLMENCDYYSSWHMNHMDETYAKLAKAYSYDELVERLNEWKEN
jgi:hypothetical protein